MKLSTRQAATQAGMSKQGIIRAIHKGQLSATRNANNEFEIDASELARVYPKPTTSVTSGEPVVDNLNQDEPKVLRERVNQLERMIADKDDTIAKLFDRLAAQQHVTLMLEDKQKPRSWWSRLLGGA